MSRLSMAQARVRREIRHIAFVLHKSEGWIPGSHVYYELSSSHVVAVLWLIESTARHTFLGAPCVAYDALRFSNVVSGLMQQMS